MLGRCHDFLFFCLGQRMDFGFHKACLHAMVGDLREEEIDLYMVETEIDEQKDCALH